MPLLALKVDVDTYRGTREGLPRVRDACARARVGATFLVSVGPDHTGRALRRVLRRGFVRKLRRTSVVSNYGVRTLLYGTLLPGPHIGRRCRDELRAVAAAGFEVGLHSWDHVRWQDGVARASRAWTRRDLLRGIDAFRDALGFEPRVHGAAGWQANRFLPELERELGFALASDTRGRAPFIALVDGVPSGPPQLPTTLPTLDELIGREDLAGEDPVDHLLARTRDGGDHVFTLHAELEGGAYLSALERLLAGWRAQGFRLCALSELAARFDPAALPRCPLELGSVPGRSGLLAVQGARAVDEPCEPRSRSTAPGLRQP